MAVEWPYWRAQGLSTWHRDMMPPSQHVSPPISALLELLQPTVSAVIVKWKHLGASTAQPRSGRSHKLTEWVCRVQKCIECRNCLSSVATLTTEFQTASGSNISQITVSRELHEMGFHGRAAAHKPKITMRNAKRLPEWCKARRHWTLEHLAVRWTNLGLVDARKTLLS